MEAARIVSFGRLKYVIVHMINIIAYYTSIYIYTKELILKLFIDLCIIRTYK